MNRLVSSITAPASAHQGRHGVRRLRAGKRGDRHRRDHGYASTMLDPRDQACDHGGVGSLVGQQDDLLALAHGQASVEHVGEPDLAVHRGVMLLPPDVSASAANTA